VSAHVRLVSAVAEAAAIRSHRAIAIARSTMHLTRITAAALTVLATVAFAAPAGAAEPAQDLRSPDARDAAALAQERYYSSDDGPAQDLRSPDARDAELISHGLLRLEPTRTPAPATVATPSSGFDWVDAAIGAAAALGIALLASGAALVVRRRSHRDEPLAAS
jgi:hypothetical protein